MVFDGEGLGDRMIKMEVEGESIGDFVLGLVFPLPLSRT